MSRVKSNPLSTRFVQPGRLAWQSFDPQRTVDALSNYFTNQLNWRAAIVGPHGSGKSTLLEHLIPRLGHVVLKRAAYDEASPVSNEPTEPIDDASREIVWLKLRGRRASVDLLRATRSMWSQPRRLLVVDGYEQLSWWSRWMLLRRTARHSGGLLVTSHRPTALATLIETQVDVRLAQSLLHQLLPAELPNREQLLSGSHLSDLLAAHHGNLREVFMQLYDELASSDSRRDAAGGRRQ